MTVVVGGEALIDLVPHRLGEQVQVRELAEYEVAL